MKKKHLYTALATLFALVVYAFVGYELVVFDGYAALGERLRTAGAGQYICLALCVGLMPVNLWLEAWKWQYLLRRIAPMTRREALRQVYTGMAGAFVTPYRIGDYPARILLLKQKEQWLSALGMALVGSFALTLVIVVCGLPALGAFFASTHLRPLAGVFAAAGGLLLLLLLSPLLQRLCRRYGATDKQDKMRLLLAELGQISGKEFASVCGLSLLRYGCFSLQLLLALSFCGLQLTATQWLTAIPLYYLLVTLSPNIPMADAGIRGAWAIFVFGHFSPVASVPAALAAGILWIVNTVVPVIYSPHPLREGK